MGSKVPANLISYYATEIKQHWHKALESIFAVCDLLIEAKNKFDPSDWELLKDDLPFSESVLKKLLVIARDGWLHRPGVQELLPPNYSIIYEVTQLTDEELATAVKTGEIWPRMNRATFIEWRKGQRGYESDQSFSKRIPSVVSACGLDRRRGDPPKQSATTEGRACLNPKTV